MRRDRSKWLLEDAKNKDPLKCASARRIDLTGKRFGRLVVLEYALTSKHGGAYWLCLCDCGNKKIIKSQHLRSGHIVSCRCANAELTAATCRRNAAKRFNPEVTGPKTIYAIYRSSARKRNLEFSIPFEEFAGLIKKDCQYCGAPPKNEQFNRSDLRPYKFKYSGLDRVNNSKGYITGNCVSCCDTCNSAKQDLSLSEFKEWITRIYRRFHDGF